MISNNKAHLNFLLLLFQEIKIGYYILSPGKLQTPAPYFLNEKARIFF